MFSYLHQLDTDLLLTLNALRAEALDPVMHTLTGRWIWIPFYALLAVIVWRRLGWRNALLAFLLIALTITLADQICGSVIRPMAMRLRPSNLDNPVSRYVSIVDGYRGGRYGMASCHAANCYALAVFLIRTLRWRGVAAAAILVWATVVVYTRIYLGVHYPGDIVVGAGVGMAIAWGTSSLYRWVTTHAGATRGWSRFLAFRWLGL